MNNLTPDTPDERLQLIAQAKEQKRLADEYKATMEAFKPRIAALKKRFNRLKAGEVSAYKVIQDSVNLEGEMVQAKADYQEAQVLLLLPDTEGSDSG